MSKKAPILPTSPNTGLPVNLVIQSHEIIELWYLTYGTTNLTIEATPEKTSINPESGQGGGTTGETSAAYAGQAVMTSTGGNYRCG